MRVVLILLASAIVCWGNDFFASGRIPHIKIEIAKTNMDSLRRDARKYVPATFRDGDTVYTNIAIRLKGAAGSFRPVDDRPALTLNFDKYVDGQKFHGLDKMHLNNSVQDPSYMTELICGELFVAAGVPAARTSHARVELNGRDLGLYVLKEGFDKTFLKRHFKNASGNLYDGGFLREITEPLEMDSGDGKDYADLKALARAAQESDPSARWAALEKVLDVERFVTYMAMETITWDWDGYPMKHNNYRVYAEPSPGKIVFLPHGMDQMFWEPQGTIFPNFDGLVARALITTPEGRRRYRDKIGILLTNVYDIAKITNRIHEVHARLRPVVGRRLDGTIADLRNRIVARADSIAQQLAIPEPKPLVFDANGEATISAWSPKTEMGQAQLTKDSEGLKIKVLQTGHTVASWRSRVSLEPGAYRLIARAQSASLAPVRDNKGEGAGIRISGTQQARGNKVVGTSPSKDLAFDFNAPGGEIELICELRATRGEVAFALPSLKLSRK
ncbi:MAG TPA: CotH kinase family protein [Verrucomicrobiae bacterium]|nr:CotH kinase family protein [Verrucomicrobiae bacterium]